MIADIGTYVQHTRISQNILVIEKRWKKRIKKLLLIKPLCGDFVGDSVARQACHPKAVLRSSGEAKRSSTNSVCDLSHNRVAVLSAEVLAALA